MSEVNDLNLLYTRHQGGSQFELPALSMYYDRPDRDIEITKKTGMKYPIYFNLKKSLSAALGNILATPTSFLINRLGIVVYRHEGRLDFSQMSHKLTQFTG